MRSCSSTADLDAVHRCSLQLAVWFTWHHVAASGQRLLHLASTTPGLDPELLSEGRHFQGGWGRATCRDPLVKELLSGGTASGPVSFMRGATRRRHDQVGGATRARRRCVLDIDHPDVEEFIQNQGARETRSGCCATPVRTWTRRPGHHQRALPERIKCAISDEFMRAVDEAAIRLSRERRRDGDRTPRRCSARWPSRVGVRRPGHPVTTTRSTTAHQNRDRAHHRDPTRVSEYMSLDNTSSTWRR